ncbi:ubiquitin carboxyl-terminal hydrolase 43a [Poecilia reticulata]|uniref:ubiquitin carboxyl-terminal hydrolase 43a n=1 Tax=Poecilia reticulata TaxID=8081 RepID=UPI0004A2DE39|nr:PREDICTED: ubiquitin carboxyl-terminal hydrolase 43 [Poecilia reticulata]XP_008412890.1 PREDICTED: ubiquitin carboxyl-terminal hydrolase 43 [Poecilia reticulata]
MDSRKESDTRKQPMKSKTSKEQKHKSGKFVRRKSLRSFGNFMGRILKTLGTLAHLGDAEPPDAEEDDGGFVRSASGGFRDDFSQTSREGAAKRSSAVSSYHGSVKERLSWCYGDKTPGVLGLKNHGNTCFMNAVVQCLSNTDLLAEYLGLGQYKSDISSGRTNGEVRADEARSSEGEVTEQLASLVRALWTLDYTPQMSGEFKSIVSKYASQFRGNSQHDALEFLLWLLDRVHEDANPTPDNNNSSKTKASSKATSASENPSSLPSTQQPRGRHSFVQEHFQAQYRSSLTCPHCLKQSNTFDPFLCISLPLPLRQTRPLCVTLVFSTKGQRYLRVGLAVPLFGSVSSLRAMVAAEGSIAPDQVILSELYSTGFQRSFSDDDDLTAIADSDVVYAFQAPPNSSRGGSVPHSGYHHSLPSSPYSSTTGPNGQKLPASGRLSSEYLNQSSSSKVLLLMCNTTGSGQQAARFGPPFLMLEDRNISWEQLQQSILSQQYYLMVNGSQAQNAGVEFKVRVVGGSATYSYLSPKDSRPLCHPAVDRALKSCGPGGPPHVKLVIEWDHSSKERLFGNIHEEVVKDAESVRSQQQQHLQQHNCTLDECFQLYTKEEQLAPDDAWKCPHCKQLQQGMVKMSLWTLPDILILHLKRFRQVGERRNKLSTLVRFPLTALNMAPHVAKSSQSMKNLHSGSSSSSRKQTSGQTHPPADSLLPQDYLYDLYAVCNHHGGMHGGHYTAYCRNSVDGQWYSYDDSSVDLVPEDEVCTKGAYILFYQRRNVIPPWSASSSVRGSISSSVSDHWLIRLTGESKRGSLVSPSSNNISSLSDPAEPPVFHNKDFEEERGGFESRPFVRGLQGRSVSMRVPSKPKESLSKKFPLRWSLGSKERRKPEQASPAAQDPDPAELVEYLESGRRPRCTKDSIVTVMNESRSSKKPSVGRAASVRSATVGSMSCVGKMEEEPHYTQVPEGQRRPSERPSEKTSGKTASLRRKKENVAKEESSGNMSASSGSNTLSRRKEGRRESSAKASQDSERKLSSSTGVRPSYSMSSLQDGTLRRQKGDKANKDHHNSEADKSKTTKDEVPKSQDSLLSFLKGNFLKKDKDSKKSKGGESGRKGGEEEGRRTLSKMSLPNGAAGGRTGVEGSKSNSSGRRTDELANGKSGRSTADIRRSQSSSNIPTKAEQSIRRTASLHRNGMSTTPAQRLTSDKQSLQRNRYSTNSLGRKKTVPESSF